MELPHLEPRSPTESPPVAALETLTVGGTDRQRSVPSIALVVFALHLDLSAQPRPDFSGSWLLDVGASIGLNDDEREKGVKLRVRQNDREIVVERQLVGGPVRVVRYALDGSETTSKAGSVEVKARSRWENERLVSTGTQTASVLLIRLSAKFDEVRYLVDDGQTMIQDSTFVRGDKSTRRRLVFHREKSEPPQSPDLRAVVGDHRVGPVRSGGSCELDTSIPHQLDDRRSIAVRIQGDPEHQRGVWLISLSVAAPRNEVEQRRPEIVAKRAAGAAPHDASVQ